MKKIIVSVVIVMFLSGCLVHPGHKGGHDGGKGKHKSSGQEKHRSR